MRQTMEYVSSITNKALHSRKYGAGTTERVHGSLADAILHIAEQNCEAVAPLQAEYESCPENMHRVRVASYEDSTHRFSVWSRPTR